MSINHLSSISAKQAENSIANTKLIPVTQWNQYHQWPTQSGLRYWIFNAKDNGFDNVIRRVGRRLLIDEAAFFEWVNAQQEGGVKNEK